MGGGNSPPPLFTLVSSHVTPESSVTPFELRMFAKSDYPPVTFFFRGTALLSPLRNTHLSVLITRILTASHWARDTPRQAVLKFEHLGSFLLTSQDGYTTTCIFQELSGYRSAISPHAFFCSCELHNVFTDARLGLGNWYIATDTDRWIYEYHDWPRCVCFTLILCQIIQPLCDACINDTPLNITLWKGRLLGRQLHLWHIKLDEITVHTIWCCCYLGVRYELLTAKVGIQHVPFLCIAAIFCSYSYLHAS